MGLCIDCKWYGTQSVSVAPEIFAHVSMCDKKSRWVIVTNDNDCVRRRRKRVLAGRKYCKKKNKDQKCTDYERAWFLRRWLNRWAT